MARFLRRRCRIGGRKRMKSIVTLAALALVASALFAAPANVPTKILSFNPPDTVSFTARTVTARSRVVDTLPAVVDSTYITTNYTIIRKADSFVVTGKQVSTDYSRDGKRVENDISRISSNITVTTELNKSGLATAVTGYESLFARIDSLPDKTTAEALKQVFSPQAMSSRDINEWNGKMSHVVDKALTLGISRHDTTSMSVGDGKSLKFYSVAEFTDTTRVNGQLRLLVRIASDTDPVGLADNLKKSAAVIGKLFSLPDSLLKPSPSSAGYHSLTEMLVDAETLLFLRETQHREVIAPVMTKDGRSVLSRMTETLDKRFDYGRK